MRAFRWLATGFVLGVLVGLAPSCGPTQALCLASNCNGCCDSAGHCNNQTGPSACGILGSACVSCVVGQVCQQGACVGGSGGDGGSCSAANCNGCCSSGNCLGGTDPTACGVNGQTCTACVSGQTCNGLGVCQNGSGACTGCFDTGGACQPGSTTLKCGTGGMQCRFCQSGQQCQAGACTTITCAGCVDAGQCITLANQTPAECGRGGAACSACPTGDSCLAGACHSSTDSGVPCGPANCAGCCNLTNNNCILVPNQGNTQCGSGTAGGACAACTTPATCQSGMCQLPADAGGSCGPSNCAGCCNGTTCVPVANETNGSCGAGGAAGGACVACTGTNTCQSGSCQPVPMCNAGNCAGCCAGTQCIQVASESNGQCGISGAACAICGTGKSCQNGTCQNTTVTCTGCTTFQCCGSDALCHDSSNATCGGNGATCANCTASTEDCGYNSLVCAPPGNGGLGTACSGDQACAAAPNANNQPDCYTGWPQGVCTEPCSNSTTAPLPCSDSSAVCVGICIQSCIFNSDCAGAPGVYQCDPDLGVCVPICNQNSDCSTFWATTGLTCNLGTGQCCGVPPYPCCAGSTCTTGSCNSFYNTCN